MSDTDESSDEIADDTEPTDPPEENVENDEAEVDSGADGDEEMGLEEALELVEKGQTDEIPPQKLSRLQELSGKIGDEEEEREDETDDETGAEPAPDSDLHDRIETLEQHLSDLEEQLDNRDGKTAEETIEGVEERVAEQDERLAQLQSEFEEHRDRAEQEREKIRKYSLQEFAIEVIRVKDSIENTIEFLDLDEDAQEQLELIDEQFQQALERSHVEPVGTGGSFELNKHKVIGEEKSEEHEPDEIVRTEKTGYRLHDRVIRPAEVVIAAPK